jgi:hypothetical protein
MVVQGDFARATIAVYGDAVSEPPVVPVTYEPKPLPVVSRHRLSAALDPSNSTDPSSLSRELLTLVPDTPSLPLIIRLMCCLKAPDGEWSPAAFPFTNLEECLENDLSGLDWLEKASDTLMTPVNENIDIDVLKNFAEKILDALPDKVWAFGRKYDAVVDLHDADQRPFVCNGWPFATCCRPACHCSMYHYGEYNFTFCPPPINITRYFRNQRICQRFLRSIS